MLGEAALALTLFGVLTVSAQGWGLWSLRAFRLSLPAPDRLLISHALGWGVMAFPLMALGLLHLLRPAALWIVVAVGILGAVTEHAFLIRIIRTLHFPRFGKPGVSLLLLSAVLLLAPLPAVLGPPAETDSLRAELAQAKYWLDHGGAVFVANYHWNQPPLAEFLYVLGLAVGPDSLPALTHWWMGVLSAAAVFSLGRRVVSKQAAALGALIYAATPTLVYSAASSKQEFFLSLFAWIALYALLAWRKDQHNGWLALAGLLAGMGAATKLMGLYTYPILGGLLVWMLWDCGERRGKSLVSAFLAFGLPAVAVILPWLLRNFAITGDPIWPAGTGLFAGRYVTPAMAGFLAGVKNDFGVGRSLPSYLFGLWHITQNYAAFSDLRTPTPPTFLLFLPALALGWRKRPRDERLALAAILLFCWGVYTFWFTQPQVPRYLYPLWGALSLAAGGGAASALEWGRAARAAVWAGLGLSVALTLALSAYVVHGYLPVLFGSESREAYLSRNVSYYDDFRVAAELTPPDARILVLEALSLYYLDRDYVMGLPPWEGYIDYEQYPSGAALLPRLRDLGITHMLWVEKADRTAKLIRDLEREGRLKEIYRNPTGRRVESRTLGRATTTLVILWQVP